MPKPARKNGLADSLMATAVLVFVYLAVGFALSLLVTLIYQAGYLGYNNFRFLSDVAGLMSLSISVIIYLLLFKKLNFSKAAQSLGFSQKKGAKKIGKLRLLWLGLAIFLAIFIFEIAVGLIGQATNTQINTNVSTVLAGAPLWFYIYSAIIEPINEELFFRGFLVPRMGILASSLIFGFAHYTYYSTFGIEVIAAFTFGTLAGYVFKKTKSIYPGIIAHILVNSLAVIVILAIG
ncbi:MAG: CPBP family intramembrane glutamic endopeptidase [Candidatus Micrarchaeaceae archaeon]